MQLTDADCCLFVMSPAGGGKGVDIFEAAVMFMSYTLVLLSPPPSLRDTSASGGHEMAIYPIATQSHAPGFPAGQAVFLGMTAETGVRRARLCRNPRSCHSIQHTPDYIPAQRDEEPAPYSIRGNPVFSVSSGYPRQSPGFGPE